MASMLEQVGWYEWLAHTNFSFKVGASHPQEMVARAAAAGYKGLAIADFDGVYGLSRTYQAHRALIKDRPDTALALHYGAEFHLRLDHALPLILQDTVVLIAQSRLGYTNLCRLASYSHRGGKIDPYVPLEYLLEAPRADVAVILPMRGLINHRGQEAAWYRKVAQLREAFGRERVYLAVSRHLHPSSDHAIRPTLALAKRLDLPCLLAQDAFFHAPEQKDLSDLLQAIRLNRTLEEAVEHQFANAERCLHSLEQLHLRFRSLPIYSAALAASAELAASCHFSFKELKYQYPKEMLPPNTTAQEYLDHLVWERARQRYDGLISDKMRQLLEHELGLVAYLEFAHYFLTVWDIVTWARSHDILCQGRGSAANSAICFILGITAIDPLTFDLLFERFISVERGDPPDIDVDFEHERREEVIQYIYQRYGRPRAAMVANIITFRSRGALRAVGKAIGIPDRLMGQAAAIISHDMHREGMESALQALQTLAKKEELGFVPWQHWSDLALRLKGFPSHLGIHSGGFIISDQPLDQLVAQEPATMKDRSVIQWCKEDIEALGFFKIDILALGMLTALRKCLSLLQTHYGKTLTLDTLPPGDDPTYDMIGRADTVGTFQIESRAQMSMLPRLKPRTFYDLTIEVAIIRPGPIQGGMIHPYLRRRDGLESPDSPDPRLTPILARTLGIPIFQEQVMRIAIAVGGFTPGEADELRRNIGTFSMKGDVDRWVGRLAAGMRINGLSDEFIDTIIRQLKGFSSYGFPESHAASFALLAYASSYLKCHYPAAFFVAILNSQPMGFYTPHVLLQTAAHLGIKVLPVCVLRSAWDHTLESPAADATPAADAASAAGLPPALTDAAGRPREYAIRLGLRLVHTLREPAAQALVAKRQLSGGWSTLLDCLKEVSLSRLDLTALAAADALKAFGLGRRAALWLAEAAPFCRLLEDVEVVPAWPEETRAERMQADFVATSTSCGPHPAAIFKEEAWCYSAPTASLKLARELPKLAARSEVVLFGLVLVRQAPPSAKGMVFLTMEDETGLMNLAFTPQTYTAYKHLIDHQTLLCLQGQLQRQGDAWSVKVQHVHAPQVQEAEVISLAQHLDQSGRSRQISELTQAIDQSRNYF